MIGRGNREFPSHQTEQTPFAARAQDLGALRDAVVDAASVGTGLWLSYLFVLFYFAIAAGAVTHRDLLLENPVKLPFLNVELPLKAFFILGPLVFLIVHAYVLLHFVLLAGKVGTFHAELQVQIAGDNTRARLRRQLPSNIFVQSLAGPRDVRIGIIGFLLRLIVQISLVAGPIALLVLFQLQFLPYHKEWITSWQRSAVVIDLVLLWILWPPIARGETARLGWNDFRRAKVGVWLLASALPVLLVVTIGTFPGEWLEENLPSLRFVPTGWPPWASERVSLHELLVAGQVNYVTGRPQSLWSNVLVLPNFEVDGRVLSLRGRSLQGVVFVNAHLEKADFTGSRLAGADFTRADLREAKFECGWVGIEQRCAQLSGAQLDSAQLQRASLDYAQLQGASIFDAKLQGASLDYAQLQGASLDGAQLQGTSLYRAQLQGAVLVDGQLQGASLDHTQLQGALLDRVQLQGASLRHVFAWRAVLPGSANATGALVEAPELGPKYYGLDCGSAAFGNVCDWSSASVATLKSLIENANPPAVVSLWESDQIAILEKLPYVQDDALAKSWTDLAIQSAQLAASYPARLAKTLERIGCAADGAPYVIGGLLRRVAKDAMLLDYRFEGHPSQEAEVAAAFLDEAHCPGAWGLSEENKAKLREIRDRGLPAPPGSGAGAQ